MVYPIEQAFTKEFLSKLKDKEVLQTQHLSHHVLPYEEYTENVGYLRALRELRESYTELMKAFFPNN